MRVLVVDDSVDAADTLAALLAQHGHDVCIAHDGAEALAVAAFSRVEAALLDIDLPGMNGFDLACCLRKEYGERLRLIAYTAWDDIHTKKQAAACGFNSHLTKPATLESLVSALRPDPSLAHPG